MRSALDLVYALTDQDISIGQRRDLTKEFSYEFGWRPNDFIETRSTLSTGSLVVEHGLDNAAVLSFLPGERRLRGVQAEERRSIVGLSYNSLVDWHVLVALLNSSVSSWFIDLNARKYRSQYNKLGVSLLRRMPIPDFGTIPFNTLRAVIDLTGVLVSQTYSTDRDLTLSLDDTVMRDLYGLSDPEIALITN